MPAKDEVAKIEALGKLSQEEQDLINSCTMIFSKKMKTGSISEAEQKNLKTLGGKKLSHSAQQYLFDELVNQITTAFPTGNLIEKLPELEQFIEEFKDNNPELDLLLKNKKKPKQ